MTEEKLEEMLLGDAEQTPTDEPEADDSEPTEAEEPEAETEEAKAEKSDKADEDEDKVADDAEETEVHTIKVDGEEIKVNLSELKAGYMKDADYRRKTADTSAKAKALEADEQRVNTAMTALAEQLQIAEQLVVSAGLNYTEEQLDNMSAENPQEYLRVTRLMQKSGDRVQAIRGELMKLDAMQKQQRDTQFSKFAKAEKAKLYDAAPEFRQESTEKRLHSWLKDTYGFKDDEISSVADHRFTLIAEKARKFDALKAKGAAKAKQVKETPKVLKSGGAKPPSSNLDKHNAFQSDLKAAREGDIGSLERALLNA
jgi:hypothetical protein